MLADPDRAGRIEGCLVALVRRHREGEPYPTPEQLLVNLPVALRALADYLLSGQATALDAAYRLASIIDAVDGAITPTPSEQRH